MGFLDELIASAKTVVGKAEQHTDNVVELSKLKYQSAQLSSELKSLYEKLGRAVYAMMNEEYDNKELVDSLADEITEVKAALAVVDEKVNERMNRKICPTCGAQNVKEAVFCMKCGALLEVEEKDGECESCGTCETCETCEEAPAAEEAPAEARESCGCAEEACETNCCASEPNENEDKTEG